MNEQTQNVKTSVKTNPPDPSRLIHGLRDTGYDFYTAAADIIDNSIAADSTKVNISIELTEDGRKFVYFGDDGSGMNEEELFNAMRYGAKERVNKASLGKFGLGLKTASSSVCLKYSLISRNTPNAPLKKLTWDLEHVDKFNKWEMLEDPITVDEEEIFDELCGETGTLVIWAKCDRLLSKVYPEAGGTREQQAVNYRKKKLKEHCSLIFHKYLNPEESFFKTVSISINGESVEHWNPFYPDRSEQVLHTRSTELMIEREDGSAHAATVKAWILPHSKDMTKEENEKYARISNRGQGFYIHREGRIIHYGGYLGLWRSDDPHWSLLRIEFDFTHELDEAFNVDVKKSRILLDPALEEELKRILTPAYNEANNRYRRKQAAKVTSGISHKNSNTTINTTKNTAKADVQSVDSSTSTAVVTNNLGSGITIKTPVESNLSTDSLYVKPVEMLASGALWEPFMASESDSNHSTGVLINKSHDYYNKIYSQLSSGASVEGLDLLIWALAAAEHKNTDEELAAVWEDIRDEVSANLKKLLRDSPLPS